jgi:hypothetical protein
VLVLHKGQAVHPANEPLPALLVTVTLEYTSPSLRAFLFISLAEAAGIDEVVVVEVEVEISCVFRFILHVAKLNGCILTDV